jgi:hypothetical protein
VSARYGDDGVLVERGGLLPFSEDELRAAERRFRAATIGPFPLLSSVCCIRLHAAASCVGLHQAPAVVLHSG